MPEGFDGIRQRSQEFKARQARRDATGGGTLFPDRFKLANGETGIVRFDDKVVWFDCHPVMRSGWQYPDHVACLDQKSEGIPCPGCEAGLPKVFKAWINLVWFDNAPVYQKHADGDKKGWFVRNERGQKIQIGTDTGLVVWNSGIRLFEELDEINANYGLTSRRFKVKRRGEKTETVYSIVPAVIDGGPEELTEQEKALFAAKPDLKLLYGPTTYQTFWPKDAVNPNANSSQGQTGSPEPSRPATPGNPFVRHAA
jgi:hypothetical protein